MAHVTALPSREELEAAHCWEAQDEVRSRPAMTEFRRRTRFHQAQWREARGHPIGTQPHVPQPGKPVRPVGSRMALDFARESGANFVTEAALLAARARTSVIEPQQSFDHQRMWADLLSSEALAFNLLGDLWREPEAADRAIHTWWPDAPGRVREIRFAHSPGRLDPAWLNSLRAFDAAVVLDAGDGTQGVLAINTRFHERNKSEIPKPENWWRYSEVAERSGAFAPGALEFLRGRSETAVMWLEHLLLFSMLQHPSAAWSWGRYVVVHPAGNVDVAELCARYRARLVDDATFSSVTLEALLDAGALPDATVAALRERYVPG